jgi:hypothetical protein
LREGHNVNLIGIEAMRASKQRGFVVNILHIVSRKLQSRAQAHRNGKFIARLKVSESKLVFVHAFANNRWTQPA